MLFGASINTCETPVNYFKKALELGEGQFVEFKVSFEKSLAREIVAFANASGNAIYLGIDDGGGVKGIPITNNRKSKIQDAANNCDPSVAIILQKVNDVLTIEVKGGNSRRISNNMPREEILKNLRLLTDDGMTIAGVLYFSKQPFKYIISSKIRCIIMLPYFETSIILV